MYISKQIQETQCISSSVAMPLMSQIKEKYRENIFILYRTRPGRDSFFFCICESMVQ